MNILPNPSPTASRNASRGRGDNDIQLLDFVQYVLILERKAMK